MKISKKQIITLIALLVIVFALPIAIFLTKKGQEIRPHALQGQADFLLSTDSVTSTVGKVIPVVVSMRLTDSTLKASGVDFVLLYDKSKLDVLNVVPQIKSVDPNAAFTDAPIVSSGGVFDGTYNFIRVAEIARMGDQFLPASTFTLAKITFVGRAQGTANIKFPDDNKYLQIVGTGTYIPPMGTPTQANLALVPAQATFSLTGTQTFTVQATFPGGSAAQKLDGFTTEIDFSKDMLMMPTGVYVDTSQSGFKKILRVDGPTQANGSGKIIISLLADVPGGGPNTSQPITIATIKLQGKTLSSSAQSISFGATQVVNSSSQALTVSTAGTTFTVQ